VGRDAAAVQAGCSVAEYTPAEVKRAIVGYGRAEKRQVQQMVKLLLGLDKVPTPHDAADALASRSVIYIRCRWRAA
jgi:crossover junction endodeoxyribonuclease RuvC